MKFLKSLIVFLFSLIMIIIVLAIGGSVLFFYLNTPPETQPTEVLEFTVLPGASLTLIAEQLEDIGLIRSSELLILYSRIRNTDANIKVGRYFISPGSSVMEIHDQLILGLQELRKVTIPEGLTASTIAKILESNNICSADEFMTIIKDPDFLLSMDVPGSSADGYLYPDTYYFQENYPAAKAVKVLIQRFFDVLSTIDPDYTSTGRDRIHQNLILASIVEEEYRLPEEAPIIAGVFLNRLTVNMPLQSCATVGYILTEIQGKPHPERIWESDLKIDSPFNTYTNYGLTPGPISNPGHTALHAVWNPAETDYLYFVVKDPVSGSHTFSKTLGQHVSAKNLYLKTR